MLGRNLDYLALLRPQRDEVPTRRKLMSDRSHSDRPSGRFHPSQSDQADVYSARKAAEALFAPKRPIADLPKPNGSGSAELDNRKPRILSVVREQPPAMPAVPREPSKPALVQHKTRRRSKRVPASQLTRLRSWVKYGMTAHQAADVYGVSVSEIERILQKP